MPSLPEPVSSHRASHRPSPRGLLGGVSAKQKCQAQYLAQVMVTESAFSMATAREALGLYRGKTLAGEVLQLLLSLKGSLTGSSTSL